MITIVRSRMKSKAPVSLVTTTATNESSPEPPNSRAEPPPRRERRIETPSELPVATCQLPGKSGAFWQLATGNCFSSYPDRFRSMGRRLGPFVEELLDDVAIEGIP